MRLSFLGAAGTVTGSKFLLQSQDFGSVLVDCGLFQGLKKLRLKNREKLSFDPAKLSAVILTHAHLDHSGLIPVLVKQGFNGPVYCTESTFDLCKILLPDSGFLQEEDARYANKKGFSKHEPALPLYTEEDAIKSLSVFKTVERHKKIPLGKNSYFEFYNAGHILGSCMVRIVADGKTIAFSGDLGRPKDIIMTSPEPPPECEYLVLESTYGNRTHENVDPSGRLMEVIQETSKNKGVVIIPSFAVGRAQAVLYLLSELRQKNLIPDIPIYLNSPMAHKATELFCEHNEETTLTKEQARRVCELFTPIRTADESKELNEKKGPMIIISASGMATGGRVVHHLKAFMGDPKNVILFAGYQAAGTRGADMVAGKEEIKIHGEYYPVKARVVNLEMLSAHADREEILAWLKTGKKLPKKIFLVHGEPDASDHLRRSIEEKLEIDVEVPYLGETTELSS